MVEQPQTSQNHLIHNPRHVRLEPEELILLALLLVHLHAHLPQVVLVARQNILSDLQVEKKSLQKHFLLIKIMSVRHKLSV